MLIATVSGSFHRHMPAIYWAVSELRELGVDVLSPADPRIVDQVGEFLFVASDRWRSVRLVQDRHLQCIAASDFLWLVTPDGYLGQSASMELGFAVAKNIPVFSTTPPTDATLRQYVHLVRDLPAALSAARSMRQTRRRLVHFLVDPVESLDRARSSLDRLTATLDRSKGNAGDDITSEIYSHADDIIEQLRHPITR